MPTDGDTPLVGFHVSVAGGLYKAFDRAERLGCSAFQIFTSNPRSWKGRIVTEEEAVAFRERAEASGIEVYFSHIPYLANFCASGELYKKSVDMLVQELKRASLLGLEGVVVHVGKLKDKGYREGIKLIASAIKTALRETEGVAILMENTAGQGSEVGYRIEQLYHIAEEVGEQDDRIALCVDTAHAFQAGYPIHTKAGLDEFLEIIDRLFGLEKLKLIHLNDSKTPFASRVDRHWHIGMGEIGEEGFRNILSHPVIRSRPLIMETPWGEDWDVRNMRKVKELLGLSGF